MLTCKAFFISVCLSLVFLTWEVNTETECETEVIADRVVNVEESLKNGAHVEVLQVYQSSNLSTCIDDCCNEKYGKCTLIGFNNVGKKIKNCYHFICSPIDLCQFINSTDTSSVRIKSDVKESLSGNSTDLLYVINSTSSSQTAKNNEQEIRSISARKGAILHDSFSDGDSTGTITARKGVSYLEEVPTAEDKTFSKPRKGVSFESDTERNLSLKKDNTTVKARKGVDATFLAEIPPTSNEDALNTSDDTAIIFHGFTEENTTQNTNEPIYKLNSTELLVETNTTDDVQSFSDKETAKVLPSSLSLRAGMVETKSSHDFTISTISYKDVQLANISLVVTNLPKNNQTSHNKNQSSPTPPETSQSDQKQPVPKEGSLFPYRFSSPIAHLVSSETFNFTSVTVKTKELKTNDDIEEFKMSSVFLVVALVMGLLLLFVVLGVISKHVHDIWMRRHYHRMDFLIDGMYDSYA